MPCHRCNDAGEVWLEDESTKKGGLWVPCRRCHCEVCAGPLDSAWGICPKCEPDKAACGGCREGLPIKDTAIGKRHEKQTSPASWLTTACTARTA